MEDPTPKIAQAIKEEKHQWTRWLNTILLTVLTSITTVMLSAARTAYESLSTKVDTVIEQNIENGKDAIRQDERIKHLGNWTQKNEDRIDRLEGRK